MSIHSATLDAISRGPISLLALETEDSRSDTPENISTSLKARSSVRWSGPFHVLVCARRLLSMEKPAPCNECGLPMKADPLPRVGHLPQQPTGIMSCGLGRSILDRLLETATPLPGTTTMSTLISILRPTNLYQQRFWLKRFKLRSANIPQSSVG
jgi:hypothetical protein